MTNTESSVAVKTAYEYLKSTSPSAGNMSNFHLEEISTDKDNYFLITLSYDEAGEFGFDKRREYKEFKVAKGGNVVWMKIKKL